MTGLSDNMRGAFLMMGSMTAFTLNDACMKAAGAELPLMQALFLRGVAVSLLLYALGRRMGALRLPAAPRDRGLLALRTLGEVAAAYFFLTALFNMPIGNVTAILQVLPLSVALAAAVFLREPLGWRRLTAIAVGFGGVMLIVRPGTEGFTVYSVYALCAVAAVTLRDLATRRMSAALPSVTVALAAALAVTAFAGAGALWVEWRPVSARSAALVGGSVVFIFAAYIFSIAAMRVGEIGFVAPFRYTGLVVALVVGAVVFGERPAAATLAGAAIVVGTGLFTLWRERRLRAQGALPPAGP